MKFNIKPEDCKYVINEEERKVVCILEGTKYLFVHFVNDNLDIPISNSSSYFISSKMIKLHDKLYMPDRFIGISTCSPDDEWDEELGKLIAFSRLKEKVNRSFFKRANTLVNTYDEWLNQTEDLFNAIGYKLTVNTNRREEYINQRLGISDAEEDTE